MKKMSLILSVFIIACGQNTGSKSTYNQNQTSITEKPNSQFSITMPLDSGAQQVSCHISKECNNEVAQLVDIEMTMSEMKFNFETIDTGETSVEITCDGIEDGDHTYTIVVAE